MASIKLIFILAYLKYASSAYFIHRNLPKVNVTGANITTHLEKAHIQRICKNRDVICKSNNTIVCAVRKNKNDYEHKSFDNACYLFLSNMCENPGKEYSIVESEDCADYLKTRRMYMYSGIELTSTTAQATTHDGNSTQNANTTVAILREGVKFSQLYEVEDAFDYHPCPLRCPNLYQPVCVSVNRGIGKYFKFWTFVNHCSGDLYYCKHWREFEPPEGEDESVISSQLAWSFCGAHRYLQFARFAEVASAMGHYGWLQGDFAYSHIMEPHERMPGFG